MKVFFCNKLQIQKKIMFYQNSSLENSSNLVTISWISFRIVLLNDRDSENVHHPKEKKLGLFSFG